MRRPFLGCLIVVAAFTGPSWGQVPSSEQAQVIVPPIRRVEPASSAASADELEKRGDELRANKDYLDALDYYREGMKEEPKNPSVHNKAGICQLQLRRPRDAAKYFQRAIKNDQKFADAYNNLGVA